MPTNENVYIIYLKEHTKIGIYVNYMLLYFLNFQNSKDDLEILFYLLALFPKTIFVFFYCGGPLFQL